MIIKEKAIFLILLPALAAVIAFGLNSQEKKRQSADESLRDIESVTEKAKAKKKAIKNDWDIEGLKKQDTLDAYSVLMERSIFFRTVSEIKQGEREEVISLKEEEPPKPVFVYKGRMALGSKIIVIIEDQNTGKSYSVKEGDAAGDFTVTAIDEKEIRLKKKDGEEIAITTVKEEKKTEQKDDAGDGLKPSPADKGSEGAE
ncbi:MAG: hypothetical protein Q8O12_00450 [Candidatus Omnitrophota bacterium]|nr:hypothetical protein [Candidatus Omnitrophota bacterium]